MEQFTYLVKDRRGVSHEGLIEAANEKAAATVLHEKGFTVIRVQAKKQGPSLPFIGGISIGVLSQFTRQLATMITSGLPLTDSLVVLQKQTENEKMRKVITAITEDIQGGNSFSSALAKHGDVFSLAYISVVRAGEASGTLDKVLAKLADTLEKDREFQGKVKGALIYPTIIIVAMLFVGAIILIFVIPKLSEVYKGMNITLPLPTLILIAISNFLVHFWWLITILAFIGWVFLRRYRKTPEGAVAIDKILLKVPVMGKLNRDTSLTTLTRTLGSLVGAGVPILEALKIAGETASNATHRLAVSRAATTVEKGATLSKALGGDETFPPIIPQMISVGEETGKMDEVLDKVSHFFELEVEQEVNTLTSALEPIIMIILGIMVGLLMISIILPIYSITKAF